MKPHVSRWVFVELFEFTCVRNYFLNSIIVKFSIQDDNSILSINFHYNDIFIFSKVSSDIVDMAFVKKVFSCRNKNWLDSRVVLYLIFSFLRFKVVEKQWIFLKVVKTSNFQILSSWIEKYKPTLSKLDSSWDNSYCMRLVIISLDVNRQAEVSLQW